MTTILGLRAGGKSYLASDRLIVQGDTRVSTVHPKIFRWGRFLLGVSGEALLYNLVEDACSEDRLQQRPLDVAATLRDLMRKSGWIPGTEPGSQDFRSSVIIAGPDGVWKAGGDWGLSEMGDGEPCGAGSGKEHAIAAADTALRLGQSPVEAMRIGMASAIKYDVYSGGEPEVWEVDEDGARVVAEGERFHFRQVDGKVYRVASGQIVDTTHIDDELLRELSAV